MKSMPDSQILNVFLLESRSCNPPFDQTRLFESTLEQSIEKSHRSNSLLAHITVNVKYHLVKIILYRRKGKTRKYFTIFRFFVRFQLITNESILPWPSWRVNTAA